MILDTTGSLIAFREGFPESVVVEGYANSKSIFSARKKARDGGIPVTVSETRRHKGRWVRYEFPYGHHLKLLMEIDSATITLPFNGGRGNVDLRRSVTLHFSPHGIAVTSYCFNLMIPYQSPSQDTPGSFEDDLR